VVTPAQPSWSSILPWVWALIAVLVSATTVLSFARTATVSAAALTYDAYAVASVDSGAIDRVEVRPTQLSDVGEWTALPSVASPRTSTTAASRSNATEAAGVGPVNAVGGTHYCVSCAIAGDSTLAGNPASAVNLHPGVPIPGGNAAIEAYAGASWRSVAGQSAIESELLAAGNGARGIVYGTNGKTAHVWNAVVQDGRVNFIDFQGIGPSGSAAFDGWTKFAFVRTG
jgi:hypothetical protein